MDKFKNILLLIFAVCTAVQMASGIGKVKLTNIQCTSLDKSFGEFTKCSLKAVKRDVVELNIYVRIQTKPLTNGTITLRFAKRGDHKQNSMFQYKVDICEFLRNARRNPMAEIFYSFFALQKYSNMNHTCPYDHDIIIDGCRVNMQPLSMLPIGQGDYKIYTTWVVHGKPSANVEFTISVS